MTVLTLGLLNPAGMAVSLSGFGYNLLWVTSGNLVGAVVFLAIPYGIAAAKNRLSRRPASIHHLRPPYLNVPSPIPLIGKSFDATLTVTN